MGIMFFDLLLLLFLRLRLLLRLRLPRAFPSGFINLAIVRRALFKLGIRRTNPDTNLRDPDTTCRDPFLTVFRSLRRRVYAIFYHMHIFLRSLLAFHSIYPN
jgi:hypothetical protein